MVFTPLFHLITNNSLVIIITNFVLWNTKEIKDL